MRSCSDAYVITWWVVCFWFIRESLMRFVLEPIARRAGIKERRAIVRFTEQGYSLCYYSEYLLHSTCTPNSRDGLRTAVFWLLGLVSPSPSTFRRVSPVLNCSTFDSTSCKSATTRISTRLSTT